MIHRDLKQYFLDPVNYSSRASLLNSDFKYAPYVFTRREWESRLHSPEDGQLKAYSFRAPG